MKTIKKIKLQNFKRFQQFSVDFDEELNLIIGDNEAGKSSILMAIDIVLSGSRNKVESIGLDSLFNQDVVIAFLASEKKYEQLPIFYIELYLDEQNNPDLNGKINSDNIVTDGLRLECKANDELSKEIKEILLQPESNFPYEYYSIIFKTFAGDSYTGFKKYFKHIVIDNAQISNEYATREYVKAMYHSSAENTEKNKHQNEYRKHKDTFKTTALSALNSRMIDYAFAIRNTSKANLETDLTLTEGDINIENKGKGKQCFIKTEFALNKANSKLDIVLLEEPENHLSHLWMKKLIFKIRSTVKKQLFITTHNNLISTRLDLRKSILLNNNSTQPLLLKALSADTATFFMKAPDNNIIEFILSKKVILVEGDAEYILLESFFKKIINAELASSDIHIISVGGTSFKRYLDIAKILRIKTAIIRDNDGDYQANCIDNYSAYQDIIFKVFGDSNNDRSTFEICLYIDNTNICEELFAAGRRTLTVQQYMLQNKADIAFELLEKKGSKVAVPKYIKEAIEWISV